ncbi:alpha/beta-hydrolase [Terfezia boudieri ATCC MYA-4762]|uniref:Alpha/beta-hydrolase n=1 Tax=Terfezia boudieri ATCC MYA-4762 TaxID=1051890 RepID=A0A3N4MF28_9PEZI|nr:alpha/beta-hydrolase [Terfezia boudieri ATCC MYA-4762]
MSSFPPFSHSSSSPSLFRHKTSLEELSARLGDSTDPSGGCAAALAASVTDHDTVILTADGHRLPGIPLPEAQQLNSSRLDLEHKHAVLNEDASSLGEQDTVTFIPLVTTARPSPSPVNVPRAPAHTHPLFPSLPLYGPTTKLRKVQSYFFRFVAGVLSTCFLLIVVTGALFKFVPESFKRLYQRTWKGEDPDRNRPFYQIELERAKNRKKQEEIWEEEAELERDYARGRAAEEFRRRHRSAERNSTEDTEKNETGAEDNPNHDGTNNKVNCPIREGGPDKLIPDIQYYARRVGLDIEEYKVETEDGFIITLQRVFDPEDPPSDENIVVDGYGNPIKWSKKGRRKYPILLIHGLLQSSGAFCVNDDDSLAFFLCKSGYDIWLGNNRCGSNPEHTLLKYSDPRMWAWNIRQMGILDLPTFVNHILSRTNFPKLALVAHSQGTAEAFVALAREQRPDLGSKISIFCALAPAVYAGKLVEEIYFKFMEAVSPGMFRLIFGIHAFIPMMMWFQRYMPGRLYGKLGYRVFSFLFKWTDIRWDRGLRDRFFRFSPVYVSAESMRWWLGRECFATQKCILATRVEEQREDDKELEREERVNRVDKEVSSASEEGIKSTGSWYDDKFPPLALWVCGSDDLVDGKRFLKRLEKGREPHVRVVHSSIIEEYEHLDVLWAIDSVEKVGWEVRDVVWKIVMEEMEKEDGKIEWRRDLAVPKGLRKGVSREEHLDYDSGVDRG